MNNFLRRLIGNEKRKVEYEKNEGRDDIGLGPAVRCKKMERFYDFEWTYKENGVIDRPRCLGCGKVFDYDGDENHTIFSIR